MPEEETYCSCQEIDAPNAMGEALDKFHIYCNDCGRVLCFKTFNLKTKTFQLTYCPTCKRWYREIFPIESLDFEPASPAEVVSAGPLFNSNEKCVIKT